MTQMCHILTFPGPSCQPSQIFMVQNGWQILGFFNPSLLVMVQNQFISWRLWWPLHLVMMPRVSLRDCSGRRLLLQVVLLPPQSHFESGSLSAGQLRSTFPTCCCRCCFCQLLSSPPAGFNDLQSDLTTTSDNLPVRKSVRAESLSFGLATCLWRVIFGLMSQPWVTWLWNHLCLLSDLAMCKQFTEIYKSFFNLNLKASAPLTFQPGWHDLAHQVLRTCHNFSFPPQVAAQMNIEQTGSKTIKYFSQQQHPLCTPKFIQQQHQNHHLHQRC